MGIGWSKRSPAAVLGSHTAGRRGPTAKGKKGSKGDDDASSSNLRTGGKWRRWPTSEVASSSSAGDHQPSSATLGEAPPDVTCGGALTWFSPVTIAY